VSAEIKFSQVNGSSAAGVGDCVTGAVVTVARGVSVDGSDAGDVVVGVVGDPPQAVRERAVSRTTTTRGVRFFM
jgi:hypothetical protein